MTLHKEINFENDLCNHLAANGWFYAEGDAACYDRGQAFFSADVIAWVQATQPKAWETLTKNQGAAAEATLLDFPRGALVHFAVGNFEVMMTTRLQGAATSFLPFNQGDNGAAGNPPNKLGHRTACLWEQVWERESWLEIIAPRPARQLPD